MFKYLHEISAKEIHYTIQQKAWCVDAQAFTSAETNTYDAYEPNNTQIELGENTSGVDAFADISFASNVNYVLDVGGGKFDVNKDYLQQKNINLLIWDPFNRPFTHNMQIRDHIKNEKADSVTSMSVLNVIPELENRLAHIATVKDALKLDGKAYFKIWQGEGSLKASCIPSVDGNSCQLNAITWRYLREIQVVFGEENVIVSDKIPNLIITHKASEQISSLQEITTLQKKSKKDTLLLNHCKKNFYNRESAKIFSNNLTLFKQLEKKMLLENKNQSAYHQNEFDKQFGLILSNHPKL